MPRINEKLTHKKIAEAKPKDKDYFLFDQDGLRMIVRPSGSKVWQLPYKFNGKNNIYTIGKFGNDAEKISLAQARTLRDEAKGLLSKGINPSHQKKTLKQQAIADTEKTFEKIAEQWYAKQSWTEKHAKNIKSRLEKDVFPIIGWKAIKDVTIQDILQILRNIEARGAISVAQRIAGYCTEIFDLGYVMGVCESNPALGRAKFLKAHKVKNRLHLSEKELPAFMKALYSYAEYNITGLSVKLLLLTLQRPGEIRGARWSEFNLKDAIWHIPAKRMKRGRDHLVPLPKQALELLDTIKSLSGDGELLFPGRLGHKKPISDVAMIKVVKKLSNNKMTPHGARHTGSTILNENNYNRDWIERQLSHVEDNKIRGTYNKAKYLEQRFEMMQWWADYLYQLKNC
ncbi:MAG: tyrosine-type recombinase/integrase [Rickettsiales bacterium]|jgi:integrase|nr:tyrosine-type recombinase/integrase [Rickettsiales bacterium]